MSTSHAGHIDDVGRCAVVSRTDLAVVPPPCGALPRRAATLAAAILAAMALAVLWIGVATGTLLAALDPVVDAWIVAVRSPGLVAAARVVTTAGQPAVMIGLLVVVVATVSWRERSWSPVLVGAAALALLGVLDNGVKALVARPRPPLAWQAVTAHGLSFPSGHALWSAGALLLVVVIVGPIRGRGVLALVALLVTVAVAASRLVLAVHYPSDVLAGWSLAVLATAGVVFVGVLVARRRTSTEQDRLGA
jgi:membrane-associated phospholipid phosphatase